MTRREILRHGASLPALAAAAAAPKYKLGVMAAMYWSVGLDAAMQRIRKAGYRYICMAARHGSDVVYSPEMTKPERAAALRRVRDHGIEPFLSLGGFGADPQTEPGLKKYIAQLDLCADYEMPVMVGGGPWYYTKFPNVPKRERDWQEEVTRFYLGLEKALRHAESIRVTIGLKPHTGITARAKDCLQVLKRASSPYLKIAWDAGNVSYYEGVHPDPDLPDLAPHVRAVCIKDHLGLRGVDNFPVPGLGQVDHELMFRTLFAKGFNGPMAIERVDGTDGGSRKLSPETVDERLTTANKYLVPLLDRITSG